MRFLFFFSLVTLLSGSANALPLLHSFPKEQKQTLSEMVKRVDAVLDFYKNDVTYPRAAAAFMGSALKGSPNKMVIKNTVNNFTKLQDLLKNIKRGHTMSLKGSSAKKHVKIVDFFVPIVNKMIMSQYNSCTKLKPGPFQYDAFVRMGKNGCLNFKDMETDINFDKSEEEVQKYAKHEGLPMPSVH